VQFALLDVEAGPEGGIGQDVRGGEDALAAEAAEDDVDDTITHAFLSSPFVKGD
jgi:hypothetical protein